MIKLRRYPCEDHGRTHGRGGLCAAAVAILLLSACAGNVVPVMPKPSEALLVDCPAPQLIPDAENQTADDINIEREVVAQHAVCWRGKFWGLRKWVRGMAK